ncbi:uncharacterized protein LOC122643554 [Telopea speciosissima]|uniref:uncharacterized protein LOC122643554 n=1 Tax=Telopea speciosissima TaxID=54955 RepID=UPI001CC68928|nr:uncharacterized protein LOC122643554 [Telopea speciosissima]
MREGISTVSRGFTHSKERGHNHSWQGGSLTARSGRWSTPTVGNTSVRSDCTHTVVLGERHNTTPVDVSFFNETSATLTETGMSFEEVGMSGRCVSRGGGFLSASTTTATTIEADVPLASDVLDNDKGVDEHCTDTSDDDYLGRESDEISDSTSNNEDDSGFEDEETEEIREQNSSETNTECESEKGDEMSNRQGAVDQQIVLSVGQDFRNVHHFREVLQEYEVQESIQVYKKKNEKNRVTGICTGKGCTWRIHASPNSDGITFVIKTLNANHTCQRSSFKNKGVRATWITKKLAINLRADLEMSIQTMDELLKEQYGVTVYPSKLYRAKWIVNEETDGSHARAYQKLESYEFMGCRPFIGLDECHLKGVYGGVLVSAISIDGNNGMFSLAYGVVKGECKDSWLFFLHHVLGCIGSVTPTGEPFTFMTNKQKGLIEAIGIKFPVAHHRHCSRHLYNNFKTQFGGGPALRRYFWDASKSYNAFGFQKAMNAMKEEKVAAYEWMMRTPVSMWARHAYDHNAKSDHITNNMTESFNQWIGSYRSKSILTLVDQIRLKLMGRFQKRYVKGCSNEDVLTPRMRQKLDILQKDVRQCHPIYARADEYEVQDGLNSYVVNLKNKTCQCDVWVATRLPCKHVGSTTNYSRVGLVEYCDPYLTTERYLMANGEMIHPLSDVKTLADTALLPPVLKRSIGRPSKNRKREANEPPKGNKKRRKNPTNICDHCKEYGYNRRTCKRGPVKGKGKRPASSQSSGVKRKNIHEEPTLSQRVTRSSQNSTTSLTVDEQDKALVERAKRAAREKARRMQKVVAVKARLVVKDGVDVVKEEMLSRRSCCH